MSKNQSQIRIKNRSLAKIQKQKNDTSEIIKSNLSRVDQMRKNNTLLQEELHNDKKYSGKTNKVTEDKVLKLQQNGIIFARSIEEESKKKATFMKQISDFELQIAEKAMVLKNLEGEKASNLSRKIKEKEHELEKKLQKYNEAMANNKTLRNQINHLRKERSLFDKIYYNLEMDIMNKKAELMDLIEKSDEKEKIKNEMQDQLIYIRSQSDKEEDIFKNEYQSML